MPSDMLREIRLGLKRFWGLRWLIKGPILAGLALLIMVIVAAAVGGSSSQKKETAVQNLSPAATVPPSVAATETSASTPEPASFSRDWAAQQIIALQAKFKAAWDDRYPVNSDPGTIYDLYAPESFDSSQCTRARFVKDWILATRTLSDTKAAQLYGAFYTSPSALGGEIVRSMTDENHIVWGITPFANATPSTAGAVLTPAGWLFDGDPCADFEG